MALVATPMTARTTNPESMAARKINSLPTNPAVGGIPASDRKKTM